MNKIKSGRNRVRSVGRSLGICRTACCVALLAVVGQCLPAITGPDSKAVGPTVHASVSPFVRYWCPLGAVFSPASLSFGAVKTASTGTLTLLNPNTCIGITVNSISLVSGTAFKVAAGGTCSAGQYLPPGTTCTVKVTFTPSGTTAFSDSLQLGYTQTSIGRKLTATASLSGN
jgi:hypothetical protein